MPDQDPRTEAVRRTSILIIDPDTATLSLPSLRARFEVCAVSSENQAIRALRTFQPTLVITELALPEGDGVSICRQAKALAANPPSVLATTAVAERVPEALIAGCDGVLLKPFAPNLLHTRIGRLLRQPAKGLSGNTIWYCAKAAYRIEHSQRVLAGTNVVWHDTYCPTCGQPDVVSFDAASHRRMWYACLPCRKVWMAPRREG